MTVQPQSDRTRVRRVPSRGVYDEETIHAILDAGFIAHVGIVQEDQPFVLPMVYARDGRRLLLHGSPGSRVLRALSGGAPACVTVTHVDGLVLARSALHHSVNYRSVVVLGRAQALPEGPEKARALDRIVEHVIPHRTEEARGPSPKESKSTAVLALPLDEASAKIRSGPPVDEEADQGLEVWAGVLPLALTASAPEPDGTGGTEAIPSKALEALMRRYAAPR